MEVLLKKFEDCLVSESKAKSTIGHAITYTRRFLCENNITNLAQVTAKIIADYSAKLQVSSQAKINMVNWALRRFCRWAGLSGLDFPKQKHVLRKAIKPLTEEELEAIDNWVYYNCREPIFVRIYILLLMFYMGLRLKEIMTLCREDFVFIDESGEGQSTIEITKQGLKRTAIVPSDFSARLQHYFRCWWEDKNAFNATIGNVNYMCRYLNQYEILGEGKKIYPELFRISFACNCLVKGMSLKDLQHLLGNKSIRTTRGYLKMMSKNKINPPKEEIAADMAKDKQFVIKQEEGEPKNYEH